jgi:hypothetical protein
VWSTASTSAPGISQAPRERASSTECIV